MSKQSDNYVRRLLENTLAAIIHHLDIVARNQKFQNVWCEALANPNDINYVAKRPIGDNGLLVDIDLVLRYSESHKTWVVCNFGPTLVGGQSELKVMEGFNLLTHYGKLPMPEIYLEQDDKVVWNSVWIVRNARDLEALFEAYDRLAKLQGCIPIFTD